jgi:hypothetical protein
VTVGGSASPGLICCHFADGSTGFDVLSTTSQSITPMALGSWERWVVVFDRGGGRLNFYRNGALDVQRQPVFPTGSVAQTNPINIGRDVEGSNNRRFAGSLDDVGIWSRALSGSEVAVDYDLSRRGYPGVLGSTGSRVARLLDADSTAPALPWGVGDDGPTLGFWEG